MYGFIPYIHIGIANKFYSIVTFQEVGSQIQELGEKSFKFDVFLDLWDLILTR